MVTKMRGELSTIPTRDQRVAVVTEVAQSVVHAAGLITGQVETSTGCWRDLASAAARREAAAHLTRALESAGALLAEGGGGGGGRGGDASEITVASPTICEYGTHSCFLYLIIEVGVGGL
jgi:hypothetical protein